MRICVGMRAGVGVLLVAAGLVAVTAGCSPLVSRAPQTAFFDFGLMDAAGAAAPWSSLPVEVVAPSWLSGSAMQYRLAWKQPERRRTYSESRWVAPPPDMLAQALRRALSGTNGNTSDDKGGARCRLRVELDEFVQVFDDEAQSRVQLVVRAQLLPARGGAAMAGREFSRIERSGTADAEGGVTAARVAVRGLAHDIVGWLDGLDRTAGQGANGIARCSSA